MRNIHRILALAATMSLSPLLQADTDTALAMLEQGKRTEAIALLEANSGDPRAQLALARLYQPTDLDEAEEWVEKALRSRPDSAEAHFQLGIIKGRQAQSATFSALSLARKSKKAFEKAVKLEPDSPTYVQGLLRFHVSAPSIAGGDLEEAERLARRLETLDPIQAVLASADIAQARDDGERAIQLLEEGIARHDQNPLLAYSAGLYYQGSENYEKAFQHFELVSDSDDEAAAVTRYAALYQLGRTAVFSGNHTQRGIEALSDYLAAAPSDPDLPGKPWAEFRLALLYEQDGRVDDARSIFLSLKNTDDDRLRKEVKKKI